MSMKRFFSATSREAIKLVRAELGDAAVILSNREVDGGVEVIASAHDDLSALIDLTPRAQRPDNPTPAVSKDLTALPTMARVAQAARATLAKATASGAALYSLSSEARIRVPPASRRHPCRLAPQLRRSPLSP
jgi:flagellar biosynthesis protein FlhF